MSVFSRMSDIINSNINALLDKAEDPEKMVRLMIQEMEETLVEVRSSSASVMVDKKEVAKRQDWLTTQAGEWQRKAEVALKKEREDLAKAALFEKNKVERESTLIEVEMEKLDGTIEQLNKDIGKLQLKIDDAKARQKTILIRAKTAESHLGVKRQMAKSSTNEAMLKFDRLEKKIDGLEAEVESYDLGQKSLSDEIEELETADQIDQQLDALKQKIAEGSSES